MTTLAAQTPASIYWRATRAYSFPASVVPIALGSAIALYLNGPRIFDSATFVLTLAGGILAHFGSNVLNDYFDFVRGVDTKPEHGSGVLTSGLLSAQQMLTFGIVLTVGAGLCGLALLTRQPQAVALLAAFGLACSVLYPAVLKKYALGDVIVMAAFGIGLTVGSYAVQTGQFRGFGIEYALLASLPVAALTDAILNINNIINRADDKAVGTNTVANLLSETAARRLQAVLLAFPILWVLIGIGAHFVAPTSLLALPLWSLAALVSLPALVKAYRTDAIPLTAMAHLAFGLPYALSFLVKPLLGH
jgi:1,4-dihydroxy-2-naphthoate octaprenyltransferase